MLRFLRSLFKSSAPAGSPSMRRPDQRLKATFVPVIFANGDDDDLPGIVAAIRNEAVMLDDTIVPPDADVYLFSRTLRITCHMLVIIGANNRSYLGPPPMLPNVPLQVVEVVKTGRRRVKIMHCNFACGDLHP